MTLNCIAIKDTRERPCRKEQKMRILNLQLFADEENADYSGIAESSMEETAALADSGQEQEYTGDSQETAAAEIGENGGPAAEPYRVFQTQEEYQSYFDDVMGKRLKGARETSEKLNRLSPIVEMLGKKYDSEKLDNEEKIRTMEQQLGDFRHQQFVAALEHDLSKLAEEKPEFYGKAASEELAGDQKFIALLSQGFSVKEAYDALHLTELLQQSAQAVGKQVVDNIVARGERPAESAAVPAAAGNVSFDVAKMTDEEIDELTKRAMRGERISL